MVGKKVIELRSVKEQIASIRSTIHSQSFDVDSALERAGRLPAELPEGYVGYAVSIAPKHFGPFLNLAIAREFWTKKSDWRLVNKIGCFPDSTSKFDPTGIRSSRRTMRMLDRLDREQPGFLTIMPVRFIELRTGDTGRTHLRAGEFFFDLATSMWMLGTHAKRLQSGTNLHLACLGNRVFGHDTFNNIPVAAYDDGHRRLYSRTLRPFNFDGLVAAVGKRMDI